MSVELKAMYQGQPGIAVATLYTVPASRKATVAEVVVTNTLAQIVNLTLYRVPNGGTPSAANAWLFYATPVAASGFVVVSVATELETPGDTIRGLASVAAALTLTISGYEEF